MASIKWNSPSFQVAIQEIDAQPGVGKCNAGAVLVYMRDNFLYYRVGTQANDTSPIVWRDEAKYGTGITPSVAVNDTGSVVEIHQSEHHDTLWYTVGTANFAQGSIDWQTAQQTDNGVAPIGIALTPTGLVVEVHKSQSHDRLWYRVGQLQGTTLTWTQDAIEYTDGVTPSVALSPDLYAVEVHQSQSHDQLWYLVGQVDTTSGKIAFGTSRNYQAGVQPTVAVAADGSVIEVHRSQSSDTLYSLLGTPNFATGTITWPSSGTTLTAGSRPSVAVDATGRAVAVYVDPTDTSHIDAVTGTLS